MPKDTIAMMSVRPFLSLSRASSARAGFACLETEIRAETVSTLGSMGRSVELALSDLATASEDERPVLLKAAADEVWAYFVQREMCGMSDHSAVIAEMHIPPCVLNRIGMVTH